MSDMNAAICFRLPRFPAMMVAATSKLLQSPSWFSVQFSALFAFIMCASLQLQQPKVWGAVGAWVHLAIKTRSFYGFGGMLMLSLC